MLLNDQTVVPDPTTDHTGSVQMSERIGYEVYGPFGQGYNIRVSANGSTATLAYHWREGPGAEVKAPSGRYEMSEESIYDSHGKTRLKLVSNEVVTDIQDELLIALFVVNHYFATKTGPFSRAHVHKP